ncbi:MAG: hypothetical protein BWY21_01900 [Parcubacteria group bacterium ADurb.Bin216]|nr:MAG: hypothetical protein BWY21_01900 [Parcubacteria group bacterium ADurb.Bin216]
MIVQIKVEVKNETEAYLLVNKINLKNEVKEVVFDKKIHKFETKDKVKNLFKNVKKI